MDTIQSSFGDPNNAIRLAYKNPDLPPSDKRWLIDSLYGRTTEIARAGSQAMAEVEKVLNKQTARSGGSEWDLITKAQNAIAARDEVVSLNVPQ
jgi:hypothetical protein